jgi:hypothetical protein
MLFNTPFSAFTIKPPFDSGVFLRKYEDEDGEIKNCIGIAFATEEGFNFAAELVDHESYTPELYEELVRKWTDFMALLPGSEVVHEHFDQD